MSPTQPPIPIPRPKAALAIRQGARIYFYKAKNNGQELNIPLTTLQSTFGALGEIQGLGEKGAGNWPGVEAPVGASESVWGMGTASVSDLRPAARRNPHW